MTLATKVLVNEQRIPFEIKASKFYNNQKSETIEKRYQDFKKSASNSKQHQLEN